MEALRIPAHEIERALPFYRALGFKLIDRQGDVLAVMRRGQLVLLLRRSEGAGHRPRPAHADQVCLVIEVADIDALLVRLMALAGRCHALPRLGAGGREALVVDPSGNPIELFEPWVASPARRPARQTAEQAP